MIKSVEIEITDEEYKKMKKLQKRFHLKINEFVTTSVRDAIQSELGTL